MDEHSLPDDFGAITSYDLLKLIRDIALCIHNDKNQSPYVDVMSDEIMMIEFDSKRFRVMIQDCSKFQ